MKYPEHRSRSDYEIIDTNAGNIGDCSLCGNKCAGNPGYRRKLAWLKERYAEGLKYKVLRSEKFGDVGMIEYARGEHAWRPVEAEGYLVIHCLMVSRKHQRKGLGSLLLESCLEDARCGRHHGVAVVASSDGFMARRDMYLKAGFVPLDKKPPYELLVKKLKKSAPDPRFVVTRERLVEQPSEGLTILAADQCPYVANSVDRIAEAARRLELEPRLVRIRSAEASRELPTPYGVFGILLDGQLIAGRPISATRFLSIMRRQGVESPNLRSGKRRKARAA